MTDCSIQGCARPRFARTWCRSHYDSKRHSGEVQVAKWSKSDPVARFLAKVDRSNGPDSCWNWLGSKHERGYGSVKFKGRKWLAHRLSWFLANGEIADGYEVDHKCFNGSCVNPAHLRLATHKQNLENLSGALSNNSTGVRGVSRVKNGKYVARTRHHGVLHHLGTFSSLIEAEAAVIAKRNELFTHNDMDRTA